MLVKCCVVGGNYDKYKKAEIGLVPYNIVIKCYLLWVRKRGLVSVPKVSSIYYKLCCCDLQSSLTAFYSLQ